MNLIRALAKAQGNIDPVIISLERKREERREGETEDEGVRIVYSPPGPSCVLPAVCP